MSFQSPFDQPDYRPKAAKKKAKKAKKRATKKVTKKKVKKRAPRKKVTKKVAKKVEGARAPQRKLARRDKKAKGRTVEALTVRVGQRGRGQRGVWVPPRVVTGAGFKYGDAIDVTYDQEANQVLIKASPGSPRAVSRHRGKPIVDLTEKALTKAMAGVDEVVVDFQIGQIVLTPAETKRRVQERLSRKDGLVGSAFTGGGFMDLAAELTGYVSRYGIEVENKYADIFEANRRGLVAIRQPVQDALSYNLHLLQTGRPELIPKVELLLMGIPCDPWSKQRDTSAYPTACSHPLYDMTQYALGLIAVSNPLNVVIEEVPGYVQDAQFGILKAVLKRAGYYVTHKVIKSESLGFLARRDRAYIVATTQKGFSWDTAIKNAKPRRKLK